MPFRENLNYLKVYVAVCLCTSVLIRMKSTKFASDHACLHKCTFDLLVPEAYILIVTQLPAWAGNSVILH